MAERDTAKMEETAELYKMVTAIKNINPNAKFTLDTSDLNTVIWHDETTPISLEDIKTEMDKL